MVDILGLPLNSRFDFSSSTTSHGVFVGPPIFLTLFDGSFLDKCVQIWIEPTMVNLFLLVVFKFIFDRESV